MGCSYGNLVCRIKPLWLQLCFFLFVTFLGFLLLKICNTKGSLPDIDLFFVAASAVTVSGLSTVETEIFSKSQTMIVIVMMIMGGEVFTSLIDLHLLSLKFKANQSTRNKIISMKSIETSGETQIELRITGTQTSKTSSLERIKSMNSEISMKNCGTILKLVVLGYLLLFILGGYLSILLYFYLIQSANDVLKEKKLSKHLSSLFLAASSFSNCGLTPTNENMIVFQKNSGMLLLLTPIILLGNTFLPFGLRIVTYWLSIFIEREEFHIILKETEKVGFGNVFQHVDTLHITFTALGFLMVQFIGFCITEWNSETLKDLNSYQKFVGSLFQIVNTRHAGENIVDLATISKSTLVLFSFMMYLPAYTSVGPYEEEDYAKIPKRKWILKDIRLSPLAYLVIAIIAICFAERQQIVEDPVNFSVLNIVVEVMSAYGNVGYSTGYSCQRRLKTDTPCKDSWAGFVGRWSTQGKVTLILVMFFGRLKKFYLTAGRAWRLRS